MSVEHTRGEHPGIASLILSKPVLNNFPFNLIILSISQEGLIELCSSVTCAKKQITGQRTRWLRDRGGRRTIQDLVPSGFSTMCMYYLLQKHFCLIATTVCCSCILIFTPIRFSKITNSDNIKCWPWNEKMRACMCCSWEFVELLEGGWRRYRFSHVKQS